MNLAFYRKKIDQYFFLSFLMTPFAWFGLNWFEGSFSTAEVIEILLYPLIYIYVAGYVAISFFIYKKHRKSLFDAIGGFPENQVSIEDIQKRLYRVQILVLILLLVYVILGPPFVMEGIRKKMELTTYVVGCLSGLPLILLYATPFIILFLKNLGLAASELPFSQKNRSLSFTQKGVLVLGQNFFGSAMIMLLYSYHISYLYSKEPNFLSLLMSRLTVTGGSTIIIMSINLILFFRSFVKPITSLRDNLRDLSEGDADLTSRLEIASRDEFGETAYSFNKFVGRIQDIISDTKSITESLHSTQNEMVQVTDDFEKSSSHQQSSMEEVTSSMEEMARGVESISTYAGIQSTDMGNLKETLSRWNVITKDMDTSLKNILGSIDAASHHAITGDKELNQTASSITKIADSAERITHVVDVIEEIADKIELLALNAAIEAARAGDSGRGFAVVASEISKLAEMTSGSIQEIVKLVQMNQKEVETGVKSVKSTVITINEILNSMKSVTKSMQSLENLMKEQVLVNQKVQHASVDVSVKAKSISDSTSEQKRGIDVIMKSLADIGKLIETTAKSGESLKLQAVENKSVSKKLAEKVRQFRA